MATTVHIDKRLANRLTRGDERAFKEFFDAYFERLYRFARSRLGDDDEAIKDVVQLTMTRALRKIHTYRGEAALFTWVCRLCRNEISDFIARNKRHVENHLPLDEPLMQSVLELVTDQQGKPDQLCERAQIGELVRHVLDHLPAAYGDVLEWKYMLGLSVEEIAKRLGTTRIAAQSALGRARESFRQSFPEAMRALNEFEANHGAGTRLA